MTPWTTFALWVRRYFRSERFLRFVARTLPRRVRYFVVIQEAADYSVRHPTALVPEITWSDIAKDLEAK